MAPPRRNELLVPGLCPWFGLSPFHEEATTTGRKFEAEPERGAEPIRIRKHNGEAKPSPHIRRQSRGEMLSQKQECWLTESTEVA